MSERSTVIRGLHDLGSAAWFGGSLAGAGAVSGAAACRCLIPALTGGVSTLTAVAGEQQRLNGQTGRAVAWLRSAA
jgi:hypothetical protein